METGGVRGEGWSKATLDFTLNSFPSSLPPNAQTHVYPFQYRRLMCSGRFYYYIIIAGIIAPRWIVYPTRFRYTLTNSLHNVYETRLLAAIFVETKVAITRVITIILGNIHTELAPYSRSMGLVFDLVLSSSYRY